MVLQWKLYWIIRFVYVEYPTNYGRLCCVIFWLILYELHMFKRDNNWNLELKEQDCEGLLIKTDIYRLPGVTLEGTIKTLSLFSYIFYTVVCFTVTNTDNKRVHPACTRLLSKWLGHLRYQIFIFIKHAWYSNENGSIELSTLFLNLDHRHSVPLYQTDSKVSYLCEIGISFNSFIRRQIYWNMYILNNLLYNHRLWSCFVDWYDLSCKYTHANIDGRYRHALYAYDTCSWIYQNNKMVMTTLFLGNTFRYFVANT